MPPSSSPFLRQRVPDAQVSMSEYLLQQSVSLANCLSSDFLKNLEADLLAGRTGSFFGKPPQSALAEDRSSA